MPFDDEGFYHKEIFPLVTRETAAFQRLEDSMINSGLAWVIPDDDDEEEAQG
jgi:hypothetical protein